ncbi:unnamed protein product [Cylindrotheca closterium]|uniref:Uncharacterized protein n=1 Tax=Cylindrotheca closterium TaxID=2856 RepID=A0AAD2FHY6_9STRA|nr:unnamed protein product [Cylindrotheca closterium]
MTNAGSIFALDSDSEEDDNLHHNIGLNKQKSSAKGLPPSGQNTASKFVGRRVWAKVAVSHSNGFCSIRNCKHDSLHPNHACIQCKCGVHNLCVQESMLMSISKEDGHWYCSKECGGSDVATHDVGVRQVATPTTTTTTTPTTTTTAVAATTTTTTTPRSTDGAKIQEENLLAAEFEDCVVDPVARNQYTKKKIDLTRLRSIAGYTVRDTSVDLMRRFVCRKLTAKQGTGRMGKGALCDLIATKIEDHQIAKANGTLDTRTKKKTAAIKIVKKWCAKRLVNVIVSNKMRNQLHRRNESITREEGII